jgi:hypothetical protein
VGSEGFEEGLWRKIRTKCAWIVETDKRENIRCLFCECFWLKDKRGEGKARRG